MKTIEKISTWDEADLALSQLGALHRSVTARETERDAQIAAAKETCRKAVEPIGHQIEDLEVELNRFVLAHQDELDGRSRTLTHGRAGFLLVKSIHIRNVKNAIAWLLEAKKLAFLHVKHELNKDALRSAPADVLRAIKGKVKERDQFWYEVDGARHAVED